MWGGHSCPPLLRLILKLACNGVDCDSPATRKSPHKVNIKGGGQECPHTCDELQSQTSSTKLDFSQAGMAELADAADSKSADLRVLGVRLPLPAPELTLVF